MAEFRRDAGNYLNSTQRVHFGAFEPSGGSYGRRVRITRRTSKNRNLRRDLDEEKRSILKIIRNDIAQSHFGRNVNNYPIRDQTVSSVVATIGDRDTLPNFDRLRNFTATHELGKGSDSIVYQVKDHHDSYCAMKITNAKTGRFRTEINLLYALKPCKHVVNIKEALENDESYVILLEEAPMTLEQLLFQEFLQEPMKESIARLLFKQILIGIKAIHDLGFIHKDIKSTNVLIFYENDSLVAKICDLGLTTRVRSQYDYQISRAMLAEFESHASYLCGTPGYMAPELLAQRVRLENAFKIDVFSAGVTLYRMLCNELPFGYYLKWYLKMSHAKYKLVKIRPSFQVYVWFKVSDKYHMGEYHEPPFDNQDPNFEYLRDEFHPLMKSVLSDTVIDLLRGMLKIRPHNRFTIRHCLKHPWFGVNQNS